MAFYIRKYHGLEWGEFELEIITPLFLAGADTNKPELRATAIKGALRFWWRALHPNLPLAKLKEDESKIFGDAGDKTGKSRIKIMISRDLSYDGKSRENPLPHKVSKFTYPCFKPGETFSIKILGDKKIFWLFQIVTVLGGLGRRSRRGFGSIRIVRSNVIDGQDNISIEDVLNLVNKVSGARFRVEADKKIAQIANTGANYPHIRTVQIGNKPFDNYKAVLIRIGQASHDYNSDFTGYAKHKKRFSSPVYVSVIRMPWNNDYRPIVTKLNAAFDPHVRFFSKDTTEKFIGHILGGK